MPFTDTDPRYYHAIPAIIDWLCKRIPAEARVLEIGPGLAPFPRADVFIDFDSAFTNGIPTEKLVRCDLAHEPLPFEDKSFDFIYCRHVLEDMCNPALLLKEMNGVGSGATLRRQVRSLS
jgi:Methyltransferase domain